MTTSLVVVTVDIPKRLSDEQRQLFSQLGKTLGKEIVAQQEKGFWDRVKDALGV